MFVIGSLLTMSHPYTGQKKIKEIIYRILEPTLEQQGWYLSKLMMDWDMLVGEQWKDHIWPVRFAPHFKNRSTGTLHVKVSHLGMQQVQFTKGFLIEKFNLYLGCPALVDIKPQLWHKASIAQNRPKLKTTTLASTFVIENIQDPQLKAALEDLGDTFMK